LTVNQKFLVRAQVEEQGDLIMPDLVHASEYTQGDLDKGLIVIGKETKTKRIDLVSRQDEVEFVPMWKQTGDKDPKRSDNDDYNWLWDGGHITKYMLDVIPKHKGVWYICIDNHSLGYIFKEDEIWHAVCTYFEAFHFHYKHKNKDKVVWALLKVHSEGHGYR
jgi:hypothetical protein